MPFRRSNLLAALLPLFLCLGAGPAAASPVDGFEGGLPFGIDSSNGIRVGFDSFAGPVSAVALGTTTAPPSPVPNAAVPNTVLRMTVDTNSFAGIVHVFENATVDRLAPATGRPTTR